MGRAGTETDLGVAWKGTFFVLTKPLLTKYTVLAFIALFFFPKYQNIIVVLHFVCYNQAILLCILNFDGMVIFPAFSSSKSKLVKSI